MSRCAPSGCLSVSLCLRERAKLTVFSASSGSLLEDVGSLSEEIGYAAARGFPPVKMLEEESIVQIAAYPKWIVGISYAPELGYQCWIIDPNLEVLNNGELYDTSSAALAAGRAYVERNRL